MGFHIGGWLYFINMLWDSSRGFVVLLFILIQFKWYKLVAFPFLKVNCLFFYLIETKNVIILKLKLFDLKIKKLFIILKNNKITEKQ